MKLLKRHIFLLELLFIGLLSLIPILWFKPDYMIFGSDSGYPLDYSQYFIQRTFTWTSSQSFGEDMSTFMGALPLHGVQYVLTTIGVSYFDIQKITLVFWFASVTLAMYFCIKYFFNKFDQWPVRLTAIVLYSINFYIFLFWTIGSQTTLSAYVFLPITFLIIFKFIDNKISPLSAAITLNIFFLLYNGGGVAGLPLLGPVIVVGLGLLIYQAVLKLDFSYLAKVFKFIAYSFVLFVFLNAYYLLPFVYSFTEQFGTLVAKTGGVEGVIEWTTFISKFDSFANLFRLQGDNIWYANNTSYPYLYLNNPVLIVASFIFSILAYSVLLFKVDIRFKKLIYFLIPLSLVGIFFSAGAHDPLGFLYILMIKLIPGFAAFRSAFYKFMPVVLFSIAILDGIAVYYITKRFKHLLNVIIPGVFIVFLLLYHLPFYDVGNFLTNNKFNTIITIPWYVREFNKQKPPFDSNFRTLVLPPLNQNLGVEIYNWDYYSGYPIFPGVSDKSYIENNAYLKLEEKQHVNRLFTYLRDYDLDSFKSEAKNLSIKYLLLTNDVYIQNIDGPRESPRKYYDILNNENFKVIWKYGKWTIYEIKGVQINPVVFTFNSLDFFEGSIEELPTISDSEQFYQGNESGKPAYIKFRNNISSLGCVTCKSSGSVHLEANLPRILPNSFLYKIKIAREGKLTEVQKQDLYLLLGLSLKRLAELKGLSGMSMVDGNKNWINTIKLLESYWVAAGKLLPNKTNNLDMDSLNTFQKYSEYEIGTLKEVYNYEASGNDTEIRKALSHSIGTITNLQTKNDSNIYKIRTDSTSVFVGENIIDNIFVDVRSLPEINGSTLYPESVMYKDQKFNIFPTNENALKLPSPESPSENVVLDFGQTPNLANGPITKKVATAYSKNEACLIYDITGFRWDKSYGISTLTVGELDNLNIYVVKNILNETKTSFKPFRTVEVDKQNKRYVYFDIMGQEDDKSISVYLCSDPGRDPSSSYKNTRIVENLNPIVYVKKTEENVLRPPKISFRKDSPVDYEIDVKNATSSYFLAFTDRYSNSWELSDSKGRSFDNNHFKLNGYGNGWLIDKEGTYKLKLRFAKQNIFEVGIGVSLVSALLVLLFIFYKLTISKNSNEKRDK